MFFEEWEKGTVYKVEGVAIEREKVLSFAKEYDPIPIHLDDAYAEKTRFGKLIAPGVMSFMAVWSKFIVRDIWGDELVAGMSTKIEWHAPVYVGDVLHAEIEVTDLIEKNRHNGIVVVCSKIYNQDNVHVITDVTDTLVKRRIQ